MQQKPSSTHSDDSQGYESFALPHIPHGNNTSHSSNVQENISSNASVAKKTEEAEHEGDVSDPPPPTIAVVPILNSAFNRRGGARWMLLSFILLFSILVATSSFAIFSYVNRPTPQKTLTTFCAALQKRDYKTAYAQLSPEMELNFSESQFAQLLASDAVVRCQYGEITVTGTSATTTLRLVHVSKGINNDKATLSKDSQGLWLINTLHLA